MDPIAHAVELSSFRARPGVSDSAIHAAYTRIRQEYMPYQPGVLHHDWFRRDSGEWVDLLVADSLEAAHRACAGWLDHPATQALMALMDPGSPRIGFWVPGPLPDFLAVEG